MQKRHFEALAKALLNSRPDEYGNSAGEQLAAEYGWREGVLAVADVCKASNQRFDRERFLLACGLSEGE